MQTRPMYIVLGAGTLLPALHSFRCVSSRPASEEQQALLHGKLPMAAL